VILDTILYLQIVVNPIAILAVSLAVSLFLRINVDVFLHLTDGLADILAVSLFLILDL
jgi:hypothetical protein